MIKSMTAYGRSSISSPVGRWVVEIHSLNRRGLDIHLHLPPQLLCFDIEIRKWVGSILQRGQVSIRVTLQSEGMGPCLSEKYYDELKNLKSTWEGFATKLGYDNTQVTIPFLASQMQLVFAEQATLDTESALTYLNKAIHSALEDLMQMKLEEGKALAKDISSRLQGLEKNVSMIMQNSSVAVSKYKERLQEKLQEFSGIPDHDERILREVAILAEKLDVSEELTRLSSHLKQCSSYLESKDLSVGRTLDFLAQEMHREVNTIAAKCADKEISALIVLMKAEVEKIREQIQNIE